MILAYLGIANVWQDGIRTAGIILAEGPSNGPQRSLDVLSIGSTTSVRQDNDLLPYIPEMRRFFTPLPQTGAQMSLKVVHVPLSDVESVTETLVKFDVPIEKLSNRKGKNFNTVVLHY